MIPDGLVLIVNKKFILKSPEKLLRGAEKINKIDNNERRSVNIYCSSIFLFTLKMVIRKKLD